MRVVRRADGDDVDFVAELIEHLAKVLELLGVGELASLLRQRFAVDIAQVQRSQTPCSPMWLVSLPPLPPTPMQAAASDCRADSSWP